jgi:hypothetical protein
MSVRSAVSSESAAGHGGCAAGHAVALAAGAFTFLGRFTGLTVR